MHVKLMQKNCVFLNRCSYTDVLAQQDASVPHDISLATNISVLLPS